MHRSPREIIVQPNDLPLAVKIVDPKRNTKKSYALVKTKAGGLCLNAPNTPTNSHSHN